MTYLQHLTDDQTALLGCGAALLAAFFLMTISSHVGRVVRGGRAAGTHRQQPRHPLSTEGNMRRRAA